jgi:hypothetical protein
MTRWRWIGAALLAIAIAGLGWFFFFPRGIPADSANGTYANDCCGEVVLRDGRMILNNEKYVTYVLGRDRSGPYVLPQRFVGTWEDLGFEIDGSRPVVKLRLDRLPKPGTIQLPAPRGSYRFERKASRHPLLERQRRQARSPKG